MKLNVLLYMKQVIISIFFILCVSHYLNGQDYIYYTQYMFNGLSINPAYAGSQDFINITGNIRDQWTGIKGAPSTQTLSAHSPILHDMFGLGFIFVNDNVGVTNQQEISLSYSYKLMLNNKSLSFGLKGGINTIHSRYELLNLDEANDESFQKDDKSILPIFGIGAYLKGEKYYVGLSVPQFFKLFTSYNNSQTFGAYKLCYLSAGYLFDLNENIRIKPSILAKANFESVFEMDINTSVYIKENYIVGMSYKTLNSLCLYFEYGWNKRYFFGYSYDIATTRMIKHQYGTHEISLNVYLDRKEETKVINPRYF
jgi:type IX secretion system PorP/SprF family membrane protein